MSEIQIKADGLFESVREDVSSLSKKDAGRPVLVNIPPAVFRTEAVTYTGRVRAWATATSIVVEGDDGRLSVVYVDYVRFTDVVTDKRQVTVLEAFQRSRTDLVWKGVKVTDIKHTQRNWAPYDIFCEDDKATYKINAWPWLKLDVVGLLTVEVTGKVDG